MTLKTCKNIMESNMIQHLAIICNNIDDALKAAAYLSPYKNLHRFFIFNFSLSPSTNLNWFAQNDDYINLGKASELDNNAEICVRAALLYIPNWWHIIFCYANDLPLLDDVNYIRDAIDLNEGFVQKGKAWSVSKEHLLLFGLAKIFGNNIIKNEEQELMEEFDIVKALQGEASPYNAIKEAFIEVCNINGMIYRGNIPKFKFDETNGFINEMLETYNIVGENPGVIFIDPNTSNDGLKLILNNIDPKTMICIVDEKPIENELNIYKSLNCDNKFYINIYLKQ